MDIKLEVLASSSIKRNKPWPKIQWVGQEHESLFMIDNEFHRISVLYVPSGKTKKKVPRLTALVDSTICVGTTRDGAYLIGLTHHGDIFFWHKDRDVLKTVRGLAGIVSSEELQQEPCRLFASADCQYFLLVIGTHNFFVWKTEQSEDILESKLPEVQGSWNKVAIPNNINIPVSCQDCAECSIDAVFFNHESLGNCCQMSVVYNIEQSLCVISLLLRFGTNAEFYSSKVAPFQVEWTVIQYPFKHIHPSYEPIQSKGAYVNCYANNGQVVAVAANQNTPGHSSMLFVSPLTDTVMVSEMKGCGVRDRYSKMGSMYWLREMTWTCDDLFLACIMNSGAVCLLSRLGEPMYIRTFGQSVELGPANFLPLHPCQYISKIDDHRSSPIHQPNMNEDPMRQRFSVSSHSSLPIILFSDGFMVTIAQTPTDMTCLTLMRDFVLFSSKHLKDMAQHENLDLTLADAYGMPSSREEKSARSVRDRKKKIQFESPDGNLNTTQESETSFLDDQQDMFQGLTAGKIAFAETELPVIHPTDLSGLDQLSTMSKQLDIAENCLFSAWKLAVSYYEPWTADAESVAKIICKNLTKLFAVLLECPGVDKVLMEYRKVSPSAQNPRLSSLINMYRKCMELLRFDIINQRLMPVTLRFSHHTLNLVLNSGELQKTDPRLKTLSGCYALMKFSETILNRVYVWVPKDVVYSGLPPESRNEQKHIYEPAILVKSQLSPRSAAKEITTSSQSENRGVALDQQSQLPSRRLCASWKLLFKAMKQHQTQLQGMDGQQKQAEQLGGLIYTIQQTIQEVEGEVVKPPSPRVNQGDKLSMDGEHTMAIEAWIAQLSNTSDRPEDVQQMSRLLHSVLYTYIIKGQLARALDFVDSLVIQAKVSTAVSEQEDRSLMMTIVTHSLKKSLDKNQVVPCIRNRCIRQLVQTLARFMAAYFSNQTVYVFPPHNPQSLPVIHMGPVQLSNRILPKYHEDITNLVRREGLGQMWTTERVLEYLLLSGLVCEAVWFAYKMGDWKAAFLLSVACTSHQIVAPRLYKKKKRPLMLPDELSPTAILRGKLEALIHLDKRKAGATVKREEKRDFIPIDNETNLVQLSRTVEDILTAGIISNVEIVPWLLSSLVDRLKHVVSNFSPLVPKDFYLPAPPVYCPQPTEADKETGGSQEAQREKRLRFQISSLVQLILVIMEASHISLPAARWYIQELTKAQSKAQQFKATTEGPCLELPEVLEKYKQKKSGFSKMQKERSVRQVVNSFRDFCTILWLLHARDRMSKILRQREERMNDVKYEDYMRESWESKEGEVWVKECFSNLQWAVHMATFSRFLPDEGCVYKIILSLLLELPPNEDTADILAEFFYDPDNLDAEVQEKLDKLLAVWQGVFIEPEDDGKSARPDTSFDNNDDDNEGRKSVTFLQVSPRGKILSVYYFKQCEVVMKVLKKRAKVFGRFEEFVYDRSGKINKTDSLKGNGHKSKNGFHIGCRPFETKTSYLEFLDSFFDISFTKILDTDTDQHKSLPLLLPFSEEICARQFRDMDEKSGTTMRSRQCLVPMTPPHRPVKRTQSESVLQYKGAKINTGFYRSVSAVETNTGADNSSEPPSSRRQSSPHGRGNMTGLASKFAQSEDALYKDSAAQEDSGGFLDVDFGTKYHHVQHLLDWLSQWGNKNHSLGLNWKREKDLEFRPTMKIIVPPTLVVLALWLVENKYTPSKKLIKSGHSSEGQNLSVIEEDTTRTNRTELEEAVIHQTQVKQVEALTGSRRSSQDKRSPNRQELGMSSSMRSFSSHHTENEYDLETEEVHTAYERVLDEDTKEESSSLEVSSLGTDEYEPEMRQTLSIIRGAKTSPQRSRRSLRHTSPDHNLSYLNRINNFQSPDRHNQQSPNTSTPKSQRSMHRTGSPRTRSSRGRNQGELGGDLASQLQGIVRSELRRIMEVQHTNMMAMMGALDDQDNSQPPPLRRYPRRPHSQSPSRGEGRMTENRGTSPMRGSRGNSLDRSTMRLEELDHSGRSRSAKKGSVGGALTELKNLQGSANRSRALSGSRSPPKSRLGGPDRKTEVKENINVQHSQQLSNEPIHFIPKFLRIPAERDMNEDQVKLPRIPSQAWREKDDEYADKPAENISIPLLNVYGAHVPSRLFPGVNKFPGNQIPQVASQNPPYGPPPQYFESYTDQQSSDQSIGIPLLKMPNETKPFLGPRPEPSFGRLLAPHLILGSEQERHQQEMAKQKHAREFHRQQVENLEELEKQRFGENRLHINLKHQELKERKEEEAKARRIKQKNRVVMSRSESPTESESRRSRTPRKAVTPRKVVTPRKAVTPRDKSTAGEEEEDYEEEESTDVAETGEDIDETLEEESDPDKLYDGYAIKPGSFDNYLELDERLGPESDTNARIQYRTAMILKKQRQKRKKVDFSTNTTEYADMGTDADEAFESVRTAEAATSITKDTGVDPIQEAIVEYNRARQGTALPPDIYLGLRFGDGENQPTSDVAPDGKQVKPKGRSYLNVVDLDAAAVLKDLRAIRDEEKVQEDLSLRPTSETLRSARGHQQGQEFANLESSLREALQPGVPVRPFRQDAVTVSMFQQHGGPTGERVSVAVMPRDSVVDTRAGIIQRLRDMNSQALAIDQMSTKIEREFQSTHMMLDTLENMVEVEETQEGDRSPSPSGKVSTRSGPASSRSRSPGPKVSHRSPEATARSGSLSPGPKRSHRSPEATARSARSTARSARSRHGGSPDLVGMSGLSGISDIIGEMVQRGEIDLEDAGYTPKEAEEFARKVKLSVRSGRSPDRELLQKSLELLEKMGVKAKPGKEEDDDERKEEIRTWMKDKRSARQEDYLRKLAELREHEHKPFKPGHDTSFRGPANELKKDRKTAGKENMDRRLEDARSLIADIITDKPKLPKQVPLREISPKRSRVSQARMDYSPRRKTMTLSPTQSRRQASPKRQPVQHSPDRRETSPKRQTVTITTDMPTEYRPGVTQSSRRVAYDDLPANPVKRQGIMKPSRDYSPPEVAQGHPGVPRLQLIDSGEILHKSMETTGGEISAYAKAVEAMEVTKSDDMFISERFVPSPEPEPRNYKPKPFHQVVKVQRPEMTRKYRQSKVAPVVTEADIRDYHDDDQTTARSMNSSKELTMEEKQKIYGSKRLPAPSRIPVASPRTVKTYTERLQEMKSKPPAFTQPIMPRSHRPGGGSVRSSQVTSVSRRRTGPPHKPLSYVERLQKLSEGTHKPRAATGRVKTATFMRSHKPIHRPQTYAEQLQSLQPKPVKKIAPARGQPRMRPYADPYRTGAPDEGDSVISDWSMDDDVKRLLYEDDASSAMPGQSVDHPMSRMSGMDYPMSEGVSDYYDVIMDSNEYVESVDIDEINRIAYAASVSSGSVMSVIDWDAIDNLISDVK
ncbi:uncharacterized protein LOC110465482 isoform X2 [Mizuhopecten yessoensis]|uniref:uncharacterized protein LOC110465482 isoform X2 n=1 Tax=Mizuhopecten yessoensis TaxID=6573 RepID=UPI000B45A445|nr:uncharacterized protein LOC110465482 isoform X2 [Mizuhopecten yessoensis]